MRRVVHVEADVSISSPAGSLALAGRGGDLRLTLPAGRLPRPALRSWFARRETLRRFATALAATGVSLTVSRGEVEVARLGAGTRPSLAARLFRLGPSVLRPAAVFAALLGHDPR